VTIFGAVERPWVLAYNIDASSELGVTLGQLAHIVKFVDSPILSEQVRESDYDALVYEGNIDSVDAGLNILQFGGSPTVDQFQYTTRNMEATFEIRLYGNGRAGRLEAPIDLPAEVASLVQQSLAPHLLPVSPRSLLRETISSWPGGIRPDPAPTVIQPFVSEHNGNACAGRWRRPVDDSWVEHWWLPLDTPHKPMWVRAAFAEWRRHDPERFPLRIEWANDPQWMTRAEIDAAELLAAAEEELRIATARLSGEVDVCRRKLASAVDAANQQERLLLTAQGDDLKAEVTATLSELGFQVVDSDELRKAEGSSLFEDLEVKDHSGWTAIVEVRGYIRGAKTSDLQRLARAARGFERRTGRDPDARWYIVNHNFAQPPGVRRPVLAGSESDVSEFAIDNGCVIDTRELFRLRESVRRGLMSSEQARELMRECRGALSHRRSQQ
jgi:hypothetical protein